MEIKGYITKVVYNNRKEAPIFFWVAQLTPAGEELKRMIRDAMQKKTKMLREVGTLSLP